MATVTKTFPAGSNIAKEILKLYPDGIVIGRCRGIVGEYGLTVYRAILKPFEPKTELKTPQLDYTEELRFEPGECILIREIKGSNVVLAGIVPQVVVSSDWFCGFTHTE